MTPLGPLGLHFGAFLLLGLSPALAAGYAGLEGDSVYYLSLTGTPDKLSGTLEVMYAVSVPSVEIKIKTFAVRGVQQGNKLSLFLNGQRWTGERTRAGMTLNLPQTSSLSLTVDFEPATPAEFKKLVQGFRSGCKCILKTDIKHSA